MYAQKFWREARQILFRGNNEKGFLGSGPAEAFLLSGMKEGHFERRSGARAPRERQ